MISKNIYITALALLGVIFSAKSQDLLTKKEAVSIALENNFDIRTADNNVSIAENNASIENSGYLPTLSANGNANYSRSDTKTTYPNDSVTDLKGAPIISYGASVGINYTLFDGTARGYAFKQLKENYRLSELQARLVIENSLLNLFNTYYGIARLTQNVTTQKQSLNISRERLTRARYSFDYGQNTQLDVLNAEVDYNTDSISYLTLTQQLENEKRNLNLLLGRDVNSSFSVDTTLVYASGLDKEELMDKARSSNVNILQEQSALQNAEYDLRITGARSIPKLGLSASYGLSYSDRGQTFFWNTQRQLGPSIGASLTWNIYDGGLTSTRKQNAKIALENQQISADQTRMEVERNVSNAWTVYQTALFVLEAERTNLATNQRNFSRTQEQYTLGQVTSIEFRQAQLNLLNAQLNFNQAKYSAKIAELALLQFSGDLLEAEF
ncbi:MAG: TolC family protein [Cyclobacteriaceae bacterium]|nr:TolC family protein [Cyclobacteriaceae bacterium]